ncbi:MMS19 nucleotide excision repair protein homolog isoform X2 [Tripterygium wilfordii]|uniref:MMS19 nucleotide excision repair protein homolog isoform X2 n=1 Tax=Tripterygium wilfordii TaxID=458696 RepID=UPI0018F81029|nr:MMS19 nucleotide excision repair protein homolog isoform X2 [Tripterygium wilfordii]
MVEQSQFTRHIELFIDSSCSVMQQTASVDAIALLLKNNVLTLEALVKELGMHLTTTDNIIRARGILLLGEVLIHLSSKLLDNATIHNLITFFTDRLADWKALRGALVGCLALMQRESIAGMVSESDAKALGQSYLQNLQVQSLGQHDRKLCYELLQCLLESYPDAAASLPKSEDACLKRDDLSNALMLAFSSTPLFEPFSVPLLLEKLSSSLPSAKVDSLKYLSNCTLKYGGDRMAKHAGSIWSSLKDAISSSLQVSGLSFVAEALNDQGSQENEITREALKLLEKVVMQNTDVYFSLLASDEDVKMIFNVISHCKKYSEIPLQSKQRLHAVALILSAFTKASVASCNRIFESYFPCLMDNLGLSVENSYVAYKSNENCVVPENLNFGALYLIIELLGACRDLITSSGELVLETTYVHEKWGYLLQSFSISLSKMVSSILATTDGHTQEAYIYLGVRGLQILAMYPGECSLVSKSTFESILMTFISIVSMDLSKTLLWKLALKSLVHIASFLNRWHESEKAQIYTSVVVDKIVSLVYLDDFSMPVPLKLEAISDVGTSGLNYMLKIVEGLGEAICAKLQRVYGDGDTKSAVIIVQLLECFSDKLLPWMQENGGCEESILRFVVCIWKQIENCVALSVGIHEKGLLVSITKAMKLAVGCCSAESQTIIVEKAYNVISARSCFPYNESTFCIPMELEGLQLTQEMGNFAGRDGWILSLFASVIIALHPQVHIPNLKALFRMFMIALLKGHIPAAQALGSIVNKFGQKSNGMEISGDCTLEEAMEIIFCTSFHRSHENGPVNRCDQVSNGNDVGLTGLCLGAANNTMLQIHSIVGLAWIGKGLLMRGHEKVIDITKVLVESLQSHGRTDILPLKQVSSDNGLDHDSCVMKCAADAFQIFMSDSEHCLNRKFHAIIRPLYKQRFSSTIMPILQSLILKSDVSSSRLLLYRAFAHVISNTPLIVILSDAKKLIPMLLDGLTVLSKDSVDKDIVYSLLLVLSGVLTDSNGQEAAIENARIIINGLTRLIDYPHMMFVRETAIQCLVALSGLPHARIYPMRMQVLQALSKSLDDPKRFVRQEAVRCRRAWSML